MREKGQTEVAKTLETPVFSRGIEILTEKFKIYIKMLQNNTILCPGTISNVAIPPQYTGSKRITSL